MTKKADSSDGRSRLARVVRWAGLGLVGGALVVVTVGWLVLRASLPRTDGTVDVAGLSAEVRVSRDSLGVPVIRAENLEDAIRTQGFLHAQDRFFQMDLTRRSGAGELVGLLGSRLLGADRSRRRRGYTRTRARRFVAELSDRGRRFIDAYTDGVNAGLQDLGARPPEYLLLRTEPEPWRPEDCVLVWMAVSSTLSVDPDENDGDVLRATLPPELVDFLSPDVTRFDVPMLVSEELPAGGYRPARVPGPEVIDLRDRDSVPRWDEPVVAFPPGVGGSNAWAVSGHLTAGEGALLASDPHVGRSVPPYFYRVEMHWQDRSAYGASIAGLPGIIIGATRDLAWGVTNAWTDQRDEVVVRLDPADSTRYLTPDGPEPFGSREELISTSGGRVDTLTVRTTRWGPVQDRDWRGRPLVRKNAALLPRPFVGPITDLLASPSVEQALGSITRLGGPSHVIVLADAAGSVGWALVGNHPRRVGFDGSRSVSWAGDGTGWDGLLTSSELPSEVDPADGRVYHGNNRTVGVDLYGEVRFLPVLRGRAMRLRALLDERKPFAESDFEAFQTDLRARVYDHVERLVLEVVEQDDPDSLLRRARRHVEAWDGTGAEDQVGFRLLDGYYGALQQRILGPLLAPAREADPDFVFRYRGKAWEAVLRILEERPPHLLPPGHESWRAFLRAVLLDLAVDMEQGSGSGGIDASWGEVKRVRYRHPLGGVPLIGSWLDMEPFPSSGNPMTVQNRGPPVGQLLRLVVDPARIERGRFHMPVGQSGHFLSPHYDDFHQSWSDREMRPLSAGPAESSFTLAPNE